MSVDLAQVGLSFETAGLKEGETAALSSFDRVEKSALKTQSTVGATGRVFEDVAKQSAKVTQATTQQASASQRAVFDYEKEAAAIRAKSTVMLSEYQVYQQVKAALEARVASGQRLVVQEQAERASLAAVVSANTATAASATTVGTSATGAAGGLRTMATGLASLAASQLGVRAGLGSLATAVGFFTVGSLTSLGVMAGLAGIALAYSLITKEARESKKAIQDVIDKLNEKARIEHQTATFDRNQVQARIAALKEERAAAQAVADAPGTDMRGEQGNQQRGLARVIALTKELKDLEDTMRHADRAVADEKQTAHEKEVQSLIQIISLQKATSADLARRKQLIAEDTAALAKGGVTLTERARLQAEINALTEAGIVKTREARAGIDQYADSIARARREAGGGGLGSPINTSAGYTTALTPETIRGFEEAERRRKEAAEKAKADAKAFNKMIDDNMAGIIYKASQIPPLAVTIFGTPEEIKAASQRFEAALRTVTDAFQRGFLDLLKGGGVKGFFDGIVGLAQQAASSILSAFTVQSLGIDDLLKKVTKGATGGSGFGGTGVSLSNVGNAAVGPSAGLGALAGPIGVAAGIVGGFLSAISGGAERARAAAEAQRVYNANLDDFIAVAHPRGVLGDALASLTNRFEELAKQAAAAAGVTTSGGAVGGLSQADIQKRIDELVGRSGVADIRAYWESLLALRKVFDENTEATKRRIASERQQLSEDLGAERTRLQGRADEAALAELQLRNAREFKALADTFQGGVVDTGLLTLLDEVQQLRVQALLAAQALAAVDKAFQGQISEFGLQAREAAASGDQPGAEFANFQSQVTEANRQYAAGLLDLDHWLRTVAVITREYNNAIEETAKALAAYNTTAREELSVRLLAAQGQDEAAEALRFRLAQERELAQAFKDGADAVTIALLNQVQAAEAIARSAQQAADASLRLAEALAAEARASEDLAVRALRATGQGGAADVGAQLFAQAEERRRAIEAGRSKAFLDQLAIVQQQEREAADAARRAAQQQVFDRAFPTTVVQDVAASANTVNLAVGLSETTGSRMTGLLTSQLVYQASLPRIESILGRMEGLLRGVRSGALDPNAIDSGLAALDADAARAAGVMSGNRV